MRCFIARRASGPERARRLRSSKRRRAPRRAQFISRRPEVPLSCLWTSCSLGRPTPEAHAHRNLGRDVRSPCARHSSMAPSLRAARALARGASTPHADDASSLRARHRDAGVALDDASETGDRRDARLLYLSGVACRNFGKSAGPWRRRQMAAGVGPPSSARTRSHSTAS